ncbi:hypothetical protein BJF93_05330 [Xaviernesmea oryzae]|uniref:YjiS-like domain-containing protein n=1 Tax=Xaviernesmea oryzae TaxID=464029 RepID=A0A1Q9ARP9_9HYPH|nr:DUF1127 domain-containing protein [Xaviernesmea oryzae]OLP58059.1 hypothetical protein BJF93_05330 [Xaviernesmea oryzae]SEL84063.1 protein of unknown function [Xaviernesmea oryzae]
MSATETHFDHPHAKGRFGLPLRGLSTMVMALIRLVRNRRTLNRLHDLNDSQLADIGISRRDLSMAATSAFFEDPTQHLSQAARRRARDRFVRVEGL